MDDPVLPHSNVSSRVRQLSKMSDSVARYATSSIAARKLASSILPLADVRDVLEADTIDCAAYAVMSWPLNWTICTRW
jgi:hypothetical protein